MKVRPVKELPRSIGTNAMMLNERLQRTIRAVVEHILDHDQPEPDLGGLSDDEFDYVANSALRRAGEPYNEHFLREALGKTARALVFPKITDLAGDLWRMLSQPELLEGVWSGWEIPRGRRGPAGSSIGTKALLIVTSVAGQSPHLQANWRLLHENGRLARTFEDVDQRSRPGRRGRPFRLHSYEHSLDQVKHLVGPVYERCLEANIAMHIALRQLLDDPRYLVWAAIDGTDVSGWADQTRGHEAELAVEEKLPHMGGRAIGYGAQGKIALDDGQTLAISANFKFWRGYYLIVLCELITGLPLVWTLRNAKRDEAKALVDLLYLLKLHWPDAPLKVVVGDGAWDEKWAHEHAFATYGVHLVARRGPAHRKVEHSLSFFESESIHRFTGEGRVFCRAHHDELAYSGADLKNGRLRYTCTQGCGRPGLPMKTHWSALTYYPHHPNGRPELHAERLALLARRNCVESLFSSIKVGNKLGLRGAARTRLREFEKVETLVSLALTFKTAAALASQRELHGLVNPLPPSLILPQAA